MPYSYVCTAVKKLKEKYKESDPFQLCETMGIKLMGMPFGDSPDCIKGFYQENRRIKVIVYNTDLPQLIQRIIVFHELGHAVLHSSKEVHAFHDVTLFDANSHAENEANLFAAEYMLDDEQVIETLNEDYTFFSAAAALNVPLEFLDFKFRVMKWKGFRISDAPIAARSNFLKNMEVPVNNDFHVC